MRTCVTILSLLLSPGSLSTCIMYHKFHLPTRVVDVAKHVCMFFVHSSIIFTVSSRVIEWNTIGPLGKSMNLLVGILWKNAALFRVSCFQSDFCRKRATLFKRSSQKSISLHVYRLGDRFFQSAKVTQKVLCAQLPGVSVA